MSVAGLISFNKKLKQLINSQTFQQGDETTRVDISSIE